MNMISAFITNLGLHPRWEGALWKVISSLSFAGLAAILKYITLHAEGQGLKVAQIVCCENVIGACFILLPQLSTLKLKPVLPRYDIHGLRIFCSVAGLLIWTQSIYYLPLSLAISLSFTGPIITLVIARIFLKENLTPLRLIAITLGLIGAWLVLRPDSKLMAGLENLEHSWFYLLLPIIATTGIAGTKVTGRAMASMGEDPRIMSTYLLLAMAPVTAMIALPNWVPLTSFQIGLLCLSGFLTALAHWSVARAYSLASIPFLTPFGFLRIFVGASLGFILFDEQTPNPTFYAGISFLFLSVFVLAIAPSERRSARPA